MSLAFVIHAFCISSGGGGVGGGGISCFSGTVTRKSGMDWENFLNVSWCSPCNLTLCVFSPCQVVFLCVLSCVALANSRLSLRGCLCLKHAGRLLQPHVHHAFQKEIDAAP